MRHSKRFEKPIRMAVLSAALLLAMAPTGRAADEKDAPTRVARISYISGAVSMQPGGNGEWTSTELNRPVTVGDRLWSDKDARAELQVGDALIHLSSTTALSFLNLDGNIVQMRLTEGLIHFRVRELHPGEIYEVDTPNLVFNVTRAGAFRVSVNEKGDVTAVTALRGEGEVTAGGQTYTVHNAERIEFRGTDHLEYASGPAPQPDSFDEWAEQRDIQSERSTSAQYVSRDVIGYQDLDDYGTWQNAPEYGYLWYPYSVPVGWAPYSYGHWVWVAPWGWTWVDYDPWGFAPFHYGRWVFWGNRWGWCPGPVYARPIYAPALVTWIGGRHWGFGFGGFWGEHVGWCPLGFGEPFYPWWRASRTYITNINVTNTVIRNRAVLNTTNVSKVNYIYAHDARAITAVSRTNFVNAHAVDRAAVRVPTGVLRSAQVNVRGSIAPTQTARLGGRVLSQSNTPPRSTEARAVMTRTAPAAAARNFPAQHIGRPVAAPRGMDAANPQVRESVQAGRATPNSVNPSTHVDARGFSSVSPRQQELQRDKPPAAWQRGGVGGVGTSNERVVQGNAGHWEAQGNTTDRGVAPRGFGQGTAPASVDRSRGTARSDRPPWAQNSAAQGTSRGPSAQSFAHENVSPGNVPRDSRAYQAPATRSYSPPQSYSAPRSYSTAPSYSAPRSYSAPHNDGPRSYSPPSSSHSYSAPSHSSGGGSYSAPSHSSGGGGGGGGWHGGGGGHSRGRG